MAISPPSDIVLDVARAAGPADIEAARAALTKRAGGASAPFSVGEAPASTLSRTATQGTDGGDATKFKHFEAMVLQTFIQNMMPKDTEGVYGKGLAGDMWKSQMAERIADVMAERGGIGIAKSMLADHYMEGKRKVPIGQVSGGPEKTEIDHRTALSTSMVQEAERKMARSMTGEEEPVKAGEKV
ncbi:MAG TPA: rod-binding protein [Mesorhizobium sp.]